MHDLEFLPPWYPQMRRKRLAVIVEMYIAASAVLIFGIWILFASHGVAVRQQTLDQLQGQITKTNDDLQRLNELQNLKQQLLHQDAVVAKLGPRVPMSRVIDAIDQVMSHDTALSELSIDMQSVSTAAPPVATGDTGAPTANTEPHIQRTLVVKMHGVAPSEAEIGDLMTRLTAVPQFSDVQETQSSDLTMNHRLMRDFVVTFAIQMH